MLKNLDPLLNADVLHALRAMGHGDELILCDTNFPADSVARTAYAATGRELDFVRDELRRAIVERRDSLPPETRRLVFDSLETIERAIGEIEAALAAAPTDPELARTYVSYRQREIDLLRHANRLASRL